MRKTFTYLSLMMAFLLIGTTSAWAQFEKRVQQYPAVDYSTTAATFSLTEVATALATDTATLAKDLNAWEEAYYSEEGTEARLFYLVQPDGTRTAEYSANGAGFWLKSDGTITAYGSGSTWFVETSWDSSADALSFNVGQYPETLAADSTATATFVLVYNDKEVTFTVGLDVIAIPSVDLMADTLALSAVEVVEEYTIVTHQFPRSNYNGDQITIDVTTALDKFGANIDAVSANLAKMLYAQYIKVIDDIPVTIDSLRNTATANVPGWWFFPEYNDATGEYSSQLHSAAFGTDSKFYVEQFKLDAETKTMSAYLGQNPNVGLAAGDSLYTSVYFVYQGKAAKINFALVIDEMETAGLADMEKVGEIEYVIEQYPTTDYSTTKIAFDAEAVAAALGCTVADFQFQALQGEGQLSTNMTANGGYWMSAEGYITNWGASATMFAEMPNDTTISVGQYPNVFSEGQSQTVEYYYTFGTKYYLAKITLNVISKPDVTLGTIVATEGYQVYIKPSGNYTDDGMETDLGYENIVKLIGEEPSTGYVLYGLTAPVAATDSTEAIPSKVSDAYSCDPKPGFWMTVGGEDGNAYVGTWGTNSFGMTWGNLGDGIIQWYQIPNQRQAGDSYNATFYIANPATGKTIQYDFIVTYTDEEIVPTVEVGKEDVTLVVAGMDPVYTPVNLQTAADSLGVTDPALFGSAVVKILKTSTQYTDAYYSDIDGWYLGADGYCIDPENEASATAPANLGFEWNYDAIDDFQFFTFTYGAVPADNEIIRTKVALEYDSKVYIFNISLMNEETATGIQAVENNAKAAGNVYDLSGRVVAKDMKSLNGLANGIYIFNGKKYIVK